MKKKKSRPVRNRQGVASMRFQNLNEIPSHVSSAGWHPETLRIITMIKAAKGKVLTVKMPSPREARTRIDAVRRAWKRKRVQFKEAARQGDTLYFRLR